MSNVNFTYLSQEDVVKSGGLDMLKTISDQAVSQLKFYFAYFQAKRVFFALALYNHFSIINYNLFLYFYLGS